MGQNTIAWTSYFLWATPYLQRRLTTGDNRVVF